MVMMDAPCQHESTYADERQQKADKVSTDLNRIELKIDAIKRSHDNYWCMTSLTCVLSLLTIFAVIFK